MLDRLDGRAFRLRETFRCHHARLLLTQVILFGGPMRVREAGRKRGHRQRWFLRLNPTPV